MVEIKKTMTTTKKMIMTIEGGVHGSENNR